jgi:hypothetical protein
MDVELWEPMARLPDETKLEVLRWTVSGLTCAELLHVVREPGWWCGDAVRMWISFQAVGRGLDVFGGSSAELATVREHLRGMCARCRMALLTVEQCLETAMCLLLVKYVMAETHDGG